MAASERRLGIRQSHDKPWLHEPFWLSTQLTGCYSGSVLRKLISRDFQSIEHPRFTWLSFLGSSILFGALLHHLWIAGIAAGMGFALIYYRRGRLVDAIAAHATCNVMLAAYVVATGSWALWN
jgi:CAAX prenyl protease-like protein